MASGVQAGCASLGTTFRFQVVPKTPENPQEARLEWLALVARLLGCSAEYLLERGFVDRHDLAEQYLHHPCLAARLIHTHPDWHLPDEFLQQYARELGAGQ